MPLHPAWVKNVSRRVLWAALDPDIKKNDRAQLCDYFEGRCAYCGHQLPARWHADHLVPVDQGGFNHVSNRVPACSQCNEKEKQERCWREFLAAKCSDNPAAHKERVETIESWIEVKKLPSPPVSDERREAWKEECTRLAAAIDASWVKLKSLTGK